MDARRLAAVLLLVAPVPALAQELPPLTGKDVTVRFAGDGRQRFYPENAQRREIEGEASMICTINDHGSLSDCALKSEEPAGVGFGEAILRLGSAMRLPPTAKDGSPTAGRKFLFVLKFGLPHGH
jgi:protein TonB